MYMSAKPFHASSNRPGEIHPRKLEKFRRQKLLHPPTRTISLMVEDLFVSLDNTSKNWVPNASGNPKNTRSSPWPQYFENYGSYKNQVVSNLKKIALNVTCSTLNIDWTAHFQPKRFKKTCKDISTAWVWAHKKFSDLNILSVISEMARRGANRENIKNTC